MFNNFQERKFVSKEGDPNSYVLLSWTFLLLSNDTSSTFGRLLFRGEGDSRKNDHGFPFLGITEHFEGSLKSSPPAGGSGSSSKFKVIGDVNNTISVHHFKMTIAIKSQAFSIHCKQKRTTTVLKSMDQDWLVVVIMMPFVRTLSFMHLCTL